MAWLYGVAARQLAASARQRARRVQAELRVAGQRWIGPDDLERIERRIDASAAARELHRAVAALPPGQREVIELVVREGVTPQPNRPADHQPAGGPRARHGDHADVGGRLPRLSPAPSPELLKQSFRFIDRLAQTLHGEAWINAAGPDAVPTLGCPGDPKP